MGEQHLLSFGKLLDENGNLDEAGYAFSLVKEYRREDIKVRKGRIKEWDYYYVGNREWGLAFTIDDNGYMGMVSLSIIDLKNSTKVEKMKIIPFTYGKMKMPSTSQTGDVVYKDKDIEMQFLHEEGKRHIKCSWKGFGNNKEDFRADLYLSETTGGNSMVIATPFKKKGHFYYNQKINNLASAGYFKLGDMQVDMGKDTCAVLDWGRGVWTYSNVWYWSSLNAVQDGHHIGWNLGYGFGDTSKASENMLFVDDKVYKLDDVVFEIPQTEKGKDDFLKPWLFKSQDGSINITFNPTFDRAGGANLLILKSSQHQLFGTFNGYIRLPNSNKTVEINDLPGFAEKCANRW